MVRHRVNIFSMFVMGWATITLLIGVGWVMNIIDLIGTSFDPLTGLAIARALGVVVVPLGTVLGYFS